MGLIDPTFGLGNRCSIHNDDAAFGLLRGCEVLLAKARCVICNALELIIGIGGGIYNVIGNSPRCQANCPIFQPLPAYPGQMGTDAAPIVVDVRRDEAFDSDDRLINGAFHRPPGEVDRWLKSLPRGRPVVRHAAVSRRPFLSWLASGREACRIDRRLWCSFPQPEPKAVGPGPASPTRAGAAFFARWRLAYFNPLPFRLAA